MLNIGGMELIVILVVALLVLGPDKLPKVMRSVGKTVGQFRRASTELQRAINLDAVENSNPPQTEIAQKNTQAQTSQSGASIPQAENAEHGSLSEHAAKVATAPRKMARPRGAATAARKARKLGTPSRRDAHNDSGTA